MRTRVLGAWAAWAGAAGALAAAEAQTPLSAIDWLDTESQGALMLNLPPDEPAVSGGAEVERIDVSPLGAPTDTGVGLLPTAVTGLPRDFWGSTPSRRLAAELDRTDAAALPAMQALFLTILLAEIDPPADGDPEDALFHARVDALMRQGAVEQAHAILDRAGPDSRASFARWFDAALLTGTEDAACQRMLGKPDLAPSLLARIFCLARGGDWNAALLTLDTGRVLGEISAAEDSLLYRFLDPEAAEEPLILPLPNDPDALTFRLYEATGDSMPTSTLPLAFAQADLRDNTGWKAQIEAAERLARSGAVGENKVFGLYTEKLPAASGGVWDRVAAVQAFDVALTAGDPAAISGTLPAAWRAMEAVELEVPFARAYAERLAGHALAGAAGALAFRIQLLGRGYEEAAQSRAPADATERFLKALARGDLAGTVPPDETARAIADGFSASAPPGAMAAEIARGNLGLPVMLAIQRMIDGAQGDLQGLTDAIALLREVGLEDAARQAALQVMILDRRG